MLFSSSFFLVYFLPVFFTVYFLVPERVKNYVIVTGSILFYAWGAPQFVFILLAAILFNFLLAHRIYQSDDRRKRGLLAFAVTVNVALLLYFKYANFFIDNVNALLGLSHHTAIAFTRVALPIGISFFTFHQLSFIIDVYRGVKPPMKNFFDYALYILLFPQLIAGPIIRYNEIADQIEGRSKGFDVDGVIAGFLRFAVGLAKKVLIANILGPEADRIFGLPADQLDSSLAWMGALTYTFQIYFDFSGYSDMAIGLGKMMGFTFPENFNMPYIAQSVTDFWKRWHISLSRWMRDYLYIPLGGNRVPAPRLYFNLWVVFLISGFWHGAEWTFIAWGAYHGLFLALERLFLLKLTSHTGKLLRTALTFFIVVCGWVQFRAESITQAGVFFERMFSFHTSGEHFYSRHFYAAFFTAALLSFIPVALPRFQPSWKSAGVSTASTFFRIAVIICILVICLGEITSSDFNPFIYFKF